MDKKIQKYSAHKNIKSMFEKIEAQLEEASAQRKDEVKKELEEKIRWEREEAKRKINQIEEEIEKRRKILKNYYSLNSEDESREANIENRIKEHFNNFMKYQEKIEELAELELQEIKAVRMLRKNLTELPPEKEEAKSLRKEIEKKIAPNLTPNLHKEKNKENSEVDWEYKPQKVSKDKDDFRKFENSTPEKSHHGYQADKKEDGDKIPEREDVKKILYMGNDYTSFKIIKYFLGRENYSVSISNNGEDLLYKNIAPKPDLILLDVTTPIMDNFPFLTSLKKDKHLSKIPVVILSRSSKEEDMIKSLEAGAVDYISKPFSPHYIEARIKKILTD